MNTSSRDWIEEAHLRLEDERALYERGRNARAVSASYYALLAAGKGLLLTAGVIIDSHKALRVHLGKEFIRHGKLSSDTASFVDELYKDRLMADYELRPFASETATRAIEEVQTCIEQLENHL